MDRQHQVRSPGGHGGEIGRTAATVGAALFGRDLLAPFPPLWPLGQRARAYRERRRDLRERAHRRRAELWRLWEQPATAPRHAVQATDRPRPSRGRVTAAAAALIVVVAVVCVLATRADPTSPAPATPTVPGAVSTVALTTTPTATDTASTSAATTVGGFAPIPAGGVAPLTPPATTSRDPASIQVLAPPAGAPSVAQLSTPTSAVADWLARTCPLDYRDPVGTAEARGRPDMTPAGWAQVDPAGSGADRASWARTVAARETGACDTPTATVDPDAPRSADAVVVSAAIDRVITGPGEAAYVETVTAARWVLRGADGLWRVDVATEGG